jgi:hypothetical protein
MSSANFLGLESASLHWRANWTALEELWRKKEVLADIDEDDFKRWM